MNPKEMIFKVWIDTLDTQTLGELAVWKIYKNRQGSLACLSFHISPIQRRTSVIFLSQESFLG